MLRKLIQRIFSKTTREDLTMYDGQVWWDGKGWRNA